MLWYLFHSLTNVPWRDQWPLLEEIRALEEHRSGWSYLWAPYWGVRIVIPRLLFLFTAKLLSFSNKPLVLINVAAQLCALGMLSLTGWRLLRRRSVPWTWLVIIVTANLVLDALQNENILWGMGVEFTIGYVAGAAAIVTFRRFPSPIPSVFLALVSTLSVGAGLLVWPVLCLEAWLFGRAKRSTLVFAAIGILATGCYMIGYQRPDMGMGLGGMIQRPVAALNVAGLILGGPISLVSRQLSTFAGYVGLIAAGYILFCVLQRARTVQPESDFAIYAMLTLFFLGVVLSIVAGRMSPEWVMARQGVPLPSRYFTPMFLFWACAFPATLALALDRSPPGRLAAAAVGAVVLVLTLGTVKWQMEAPASWAFLFRTMDAAASAFFIGASDEEYLSTMYPEAPLRDRGVEYLRQKRWSVFAEARAGWIGKKLHETFSLAPAGLCRGTVEGMKPIAQFPALRVTGRVLANKSCSSDPVEIVITDRDDVILGLGRTLLPTFTAWDALDVKFLAYSRLPAGTNSLRVYASVPGGRMSLLTERESVSMALLSLSHSEQFVHRTR